MSQPRPYRAGRSPWVAVAAGSLALIALLAVALVLLTGKGGGDRASTLTIYCAAGIKPPVLETARRYEEVYGVRIRLNYDNSGGLLSSIEIHPRGDLYIPADGLFIERARKKGLVAEAVPLARFRLMVAVKPGNEKGIASLDDLLRDDVSYVLCNEEAGAGKMTIDMLERAGRWEEIRRGAKVFKPTVTDAASVLRASSALDAAIVWDSTALQYGLEVVAVPEFEEAVAEIHAGVLAASDRPAVALRFARYLAAPEKGAELFRKHRYEPAGGDPWAEVPELTVFCGGVNRHAVDETLREFEEREGCRINEIYGGCGVLVGQIQSSPKKADAFLTCDTSYMDKVKDLFLEASDVSETPIVLLARKGSGIGGLDDLAREGVSVGITDPRYSALGDLSVRLLEEVGLYEAVKPNIKVSSTTAHELVLAVEAHDKLDVAMVYRANCQNIGDDLEIIPIDHPGARAIQDIAVGRGSRYPRLARRLLEAIVSERSSERFQAGGFSWRAGRGP